MTPQRTRSAVVTAALLAVVAVASAACSSPASTAEEQTTTTTVVAAEPGELCESTPLVRDPEVCGSVTVAGRSVRYALIPASGTETDATVLIDPGGPGASPLAGAGPATLAAGLAPGLGGRYNVLVLEEPWVTRDVPDECSGAMTDFYLALREGTDAGPSAAAMGERCGLEGTPQWGFSAADHAALVSAVETEAAVDVVGFVGASFGARRSEYLRGTGLAWAVLVRPYPADVDGTALLEARARGINNRYPVTDVESATVETRSLPVTALDQASARVLAGQSGRAAANPSEVGAYSDALWQRYGTDSISPAMLAYWEEVCATSHQWPPAVWDGTASDVFGFLTAFHAPCAHARRTELPTGAIAGAECAVLSSADTVAPAELAEGPLAARGVNVVQSEVAAHGSPDGLEQCLELVGA